MMKWETSLKIVKFRRLQDPGLLLKGAIETIQNELKEKKEDSLVCY